MNGNRLIAHTLICVDGKYLVTKRSKEERPYPEYWDIPGGIVEYGELPRDGAIRETMEEVGLKVKLIRVIHEDSELDKVKDKIYIRLVYLCELDDDIKNIKLDEEEHSEYRLISSIDELKDEKVIPFIIDLFKNEI